MSESQIVAEVIKGAGIPGVVFLIWYLYHKSQSKSWEKQQEMQAEQQKLTFQAMAKQQETQLNSYAQLIEGHKEREDKNFHIMERYAETLEYHGACLARMEKGIQDNQFCPLVRKEGGKL